MSAIDRGREALAVWRADAPADYASASPHLSAALRAHVGSARATAFAPALGDFGRAVAAVVEPAAATMERHHREFPAHVAFDGIGTETHEIEFHPAYREAGRAVWASGLLSLGRGGATAFEQASLFYVLSNVGEGGHACPAVCTAGLARAVERRGSAGLVDAYLPGLLETDYDRCLRGSQFLTEVQGGSDVGANAMVAEADPGEPGAWRLSGEKWFCSVADADLFAVTARPAGAEPGTRGLGCFLVPRRLPDGRLNGFRIRRLKDKFGTRCLASAEIDFDDAIAWPIGAVEEGFRVAVEELLDTSRWLNAVGSTGIMRRAYLEASSFARHREAFGRSIGGFPLVRSQLASMKLDEFAALSSTFVLTSLQERRDAGTASEEESAAYRILVNANKYVTSIDATDVVHRGIEALGGNGTIEDFSALPRLYRDAIVYESWEGTHNVLCAQVQRDLGHRGLLAPLEAWVLRALEESEGDVEAARAAYASLAPEMRESVAGAERGSVAFRSQLETLVRVIQSIGLATEAARGGAEERAAADAFVERHLGGWRAGRNSQMAPARVDALIGPDVD